MSYAPRFALLAGATLLVWGCASLKDAETGAAPPADAAAAAVDGDDPRAPPDANSSETTPGNEAGPVVDAGPDVDPATVGAGPLGALPTGYCCAADNECRNRHCQVVNGTKMCLDFCLGDDTCTGVAAGFHCALTGAGYGFCEPATSITTCAPQALYRHGTKPQGSCCQQLSDGRMGSECLSGVCAQNGAQNPFVCSNDCGGVMCPPTWTCGHADDFGLRYECYPVSQSYGCTP